MKVMVIGNGGREHAIIKKIKQSPLVTEIYAIPGNGGISKDATCININAKDIDKIVEFAASKKIETTQEFSDELDRILQKLNNEETANEDETTDYTNMF